MRPLDKGIDLTKQAVKATSQAVQSAAAAVPSPSSVRTRKHVEAADGDHDDGDKNGETTKTTTEDEDEPKREQTLAQKRVAGTKKVLIDGPRQAVKATSECVAGAVGAVMLPRTASSEGHSDVNESMRTDAAVSTEGSIMRMGGLQTLQKESGATNKQEDSSNSKVGEGSVANNRGTVTSRKAGSKVASTNGDDSILTIQMGPIYELLLHDATIMLTLALIIAGVPTWRNWDLVMQNQIPFSVHVTWMIFVFQAGIEIGRLCGMRSLPGAVVATDQETESTRGAASNLADSSAVPATIAVPDKLKKRPQSYREGYTLAIRMFQPVQRGRVRLKFVPGSGSFHASSRQSVSWFGFRTIVERSKTVNERVWSTLGKSHLRKQWEISGFVKVTDPLMKRLLENPDFRRKKLKEVVEGESQHYNGDSQDATRDEAIESSGRIGTFDLAKYEASSLEEDVIDPCFPLRGMDVWLTDAAEDDMVSHPFLNKNGLRSKPTMLVNGLVSWANVLIYFELPDWFTDFEDIVENENDPEDVKAVKRFLTGTDEYRDERLKLLPCLVDAPMPIKIIAPPKKELTIHGALLPTKWIKHPRETRPDGTVLEACLELEIDVMSNSPIRKISNMLRRYVKCISLDVALVIEKPDKQKEPEPAACLALWRFDMIDVETCPPLPPREAATVEYDSRRASCLVGLTKEELNRLVAEEEGEPVLSAAG